MRGPSADIAINTHELVESPGTSRQPLRCGDSVQTQARRRWGDIQGDNGAGGLPRTECLW